MTVEVVVTALAVADLQNIGEWLVLWGILIGVTILFVILWITLGGTAIWED